MSHCHTSVALCFCFLCSIPCFAGDTQTSLQNENVARWSLYSRRQEEKAGEKMAVKIEQPGHVFQDPVVVGYVNRIAQRLVASSGCNEKVTVKVLVHPAFNAITAPGGRIYVTVGLLQGVTREDELAAVLAHEVAHVAAHDWANQRSKRVVMRAGELALPFVVPFGVGGLAGLGLDKATPYALDDFNRQAENDADSRGLEYLYRAGYDPSAFITFFKKASDIEQHDSEGNDWKRRDHPQTTLRIARLQAKIKTLPPASGRSPAVSGEFAKIQNRLPEMGGEYQTTRLDTNRHTVTIPPRIIQPSEITKFDQDETPPLLKWTDANSPDDGQE